MGWLLLIVSIVALVCAGQWVFHRRQAGRDAIYAGTTPGVIPATAAIEWVKDIEYRGPVAVAFAPPKDASPGMIGLVIDDELQPHDLTATVVDLAVRGHLSIEVVEEPGKRKDWLLTRRETSPSNDRLLSYESQFLKRLFQTGQQVRMTELRRRHPEVFHRLGEGIAGQVTRQGWYERNPISGRKPPRRFQRVLIGLGAGVMSIALAPSVLGVAAAVIFGAATAVTMADPGARVPRTAIGTAVRIQALGFKQYLATAEANQIKFEEAAAIFSRYLPYAMVFGVAQHWAKVFKDIAVKAEAEGIPFDVDLGWLILADVATEIGVWAAMGAFEGLGELIDASDFVDGLGDIFGGIGEAVGDFLGDVIDF